MLNSWENPQFAKEYMQNAIDIDMNWYEYAVNSKSIFSMIPREVGSILDFGCGPGGFTTQLKEQGYEVDGCDSSLAMIELAKKHFKEIDFFIWDGSCANLPAIKYDAIISKLALHFVEDLTKLTLQFTKILCSKGILIISVPHPIATMSKVSGTYSESVCYDTEVGSYGMKATMIHRSLQDYMNPFLRNGFVLTNVVEPFIPVEVIERYDIKKGYIQVPRRLNLRFERVE